MYRMSLALSDGHFEEAPSSFRSPRRYGSEVEASVATVLVEMAAADGKFNFSEARKIVQLLSRFFATDSKNAFEMLSRANVRRNSGFSLAEAAKRLRSQLGKEDLSAVFAMADRVMVHDRIIHSGERALRERLGRMLGLSEDQQLRALYEARLAQEVGDIVHNLACRVAE